MRLKKLGKIMVCSLLSIGVAVSLVGCSGGDNVSHSGGKLVKISCVVSSQQPATIALKEIFKPRIEELTEGRYNIEIYDSGTLGSERSTYDYTRSGIIEMCLVGTPMWSETPIMSVPDFPFVFRDVNHARNCYQGEVGEYIAETLEAEQPVQLMSWFPNGARVFTSSKKLESLDDFKGQKLRMPNNPIHVKLAESLGANVVIMDIGEVFTALEQGVVDGQDNPLTTVKNEGWYEVQDYVYETHHIIASLELFASNEFWEDLSTEDQAIFEQVAKETSDYAWNLYIEQLEEDKQFMKDSGLSVEEISSEEREVIIDMIQPVYKYLNDKYDWAQDIMDMIAQTE